MDDAAIEADVAAPLLALLVEVQLAQDDVDASLEPPPPEMAALLQTVSADSEASRDFVSVLAGTNTLPAFLSPDNVGAIMARSAVLSEASAAE